MNKKIAVLTSGGDAPGMNACIRAIVITAKRLGYETIGYEHGYNGLLTQQYRQLDTKKVHNLSQRGGTVLRSARCPEFKTEQAGKQAATHLDNADVDALIVIGGDGSFRGAQHLSQFWQGQVIGIPGTIDNDIFGTDATIGYYTAIETAVESIDKVRDTADAFERIFLVEVMGRHAGFLGLNAAIAAGANYVILPELFQDEATTLSDLEIQLSRHRHKYGHESFIVVLTEKLWPGGVEALATQLASKTQAEIRPVILGHVQRGGSPVSQDRLLADKMGVHAVHAISEGKTGVMIAEQHQTCIEVPLSQTWGNRKPIDTTSMTSLNVLLNNRHNN